MSSIVFIVLDTLRKDYGEKYFNQMLQEFGFTYYPNAVAPAPWTVPTHVSLFTGTYPAIHGIHETKKLKIPNIKVKNISNEFLPVKLSDIGYHTVLISANALIQPNFGFKGFQETYDIFWAPPRRLSHSDLETIQKHRSSKKHSYVTTAFKLLRHKKVGVLWNAALTVFWNRVLARLKNYPLEKGVTRAVSILKTLELHDKNFIFINLMEVHEPYSMKHPSQGGIVLTLTNKVAADIITDWRRGYEKEAKYLMNKLEALLKILKQKIDFDESLIIITSDHGQLLGEDFRIGHGAFLDDELIRVPLWIKYPKSIDVQVDGTDTTTKYIPLTQLYDFITQGTMDELQPITPEDIAFSESYGSPNYIPQEKYSTGTEVRLKEIEKYRIAIYYKNFKGIFNVTDWKFEEIKSYDPNIEVTEDIIKHMKKEVIRFLKTATVAKVPKIKI